MLSERIIIDCNGDLILTLHPKHSEPLLFATPIQCQVSSRALRATSPYFAVISKNSFADSRAVDDGKFHFQAFDFDAKAFEYILIALHTPAPGVSLEELPGSPALSNSWHGPRLPRTVPPDLLVDIAEVMEYYQVPVLDPVIVDSWFDAYRKTHAQDSGDWLCLPSGVDDGSQKQLIMWLYLGIAFEIRSICDHATERICAIRANPTENFGYSIPKHVLEKIDGEIERRAIPRERSPRFLGASVPAVLSDWRFKEEQLRWFDILQRGRHERRVCAGEHEGQLGRAK